MKTLGIIRNVLIIALISAIFTSTVHAHNTANSIPVMRSPEEAVSWIAGNFQYRLSFPNKPQNIQQIIDTKKGDCDDFALLATKALGQMGIEAKIVVLNFRGLRVKHAICVWRDNNGTYSYISNTILRRTGEANIYRAISKHYPDIESLEIVDDNRKPIGTIASA